MPRNNFTFDEAPNYTFLGEIRQAKVWWPNTCLCNQAITDFGDECFAGRAGKNICVDAATNKGG